MAKIFNICAGPMLAAATAALMAGCAEKNAQVDLQFPEDFEGKTVELISFEDSLSLAQAQIAGGAATFILQENDSLKFPVLSQIMVDGRVKGYYVIEPGRAQWCDTLSVAKGTATNEKFAGLIRELDEAEEAEDFEVLTAFAEKKYNANKDNVMAPFFGVEWLKWADPLKVDSLLAEAPANFKNSKRAERYIKFARLRARTAPGMPYADFSGEKADGSVVNLSEYIKPGSVTIVDFMASWCPYCIKDMPRLKEIRKEYGGHGLNLVSVAVRDTPEATAEAVKKHGVEWPVVYNAQKKPYDIYGFSGIPHYVLIGADGKIVARSSSLADIEKALPALYQE